jgi:RHS repeat-associated protein
MTIERRLLIVVAVASMTAWLPGRSAAECPENTSCNENEGFFFDPDQNDDGIFDPNAGEDIRIAYWTSDHAKKGLDEVEEHRNKIFFGADLTSLFPTPSPTVNFSSSASDAASLDTLGAQQDACDVVNSSPYEGTVSVPVATSVSGARVVSNPIVEFGSTHLDPVDPITGEFFIQEVDLAFPSHGVPFSLTRTYRSRIDFAGPFGPMWDHTYNQRLVNRPEVDSEGAPVAPAHPRLGIAIVAPGDVEADVGPSQPNCGAHLVLSAGDATTIRFNENGAGPSSRAYWSSAPHLRLVGLDAGSETTWTLRSPAGDTRYFDADGLLARWEDSNGVGLDVHWSGSGAQARVDHVVDSSGRVIEFEYSSSGFLERVSDPVSQLAATYEPGSDGELEVVHRGDGKSSRYQYDVDRNRVAGDWIPEQQLRAACESACQMTDYTCDAGGACDEPVAQATDACLDWLDEGCPDECEASCSGGGRCELPCIELCSENAYVNESLRLQCSTIYQNHGPKEVCESCDNECDDQVAPFTCGWIRDMMGFPINDDVCHDNVESCCADGEGCLAGSCNQHRQCEDTCRLAFLGTVDGYTTCEVPHAEDQPDPRNAPSGCWAMARRECRDKCTSDCGLGCSNECALQCQPSLCADLHLTETCESSCTAGCLATGRLANLGRFGRQTDLNFNIVRVFDGNDDLYITNEYGQDPQSPDFDSVISQAFGEHHPTLARVDLIAKPNGPVPGWATGLYVTRDDYVPVEICPFTCEAPSSPGDLVVPIGDLLYEFDAGSLRSPDTGFEVSRTLSTAVKPTLVEFTRNGAGTVVGAIDRRTSNTNYFATTAVSLPMTLSDGATVTLTTSASGAVAISGSTAGKDQLLAMERMTLFTAPDGRVKAYAGAPIEVLQLTNGSCSQPFHVQPVSASEVRLSPATACQGELWVTPVAGMHADQTQAAAYPRDGAAALLMPSFRPTSLSPTRAGYLFRQGIDGRRTRELAPSGAGRSAAEAASPNLAKQVPLLSAPTQATPASAPLYVFHFGRSNTNPPEFPSDDWWDDLQDAVLTEAPGCDPTLPDPVRTGVGDLPSLASVIKDVHGARWTYYADERHRIIRTVNHETGATRSYNYDPAGQLTAMLEPDGARTCLFLDDSGNITRRLNVPARVEGVPLPDPIDENYRYHEVNSALTWVSDPRSPTDLLATLQTIVRDANGNPVRVVEADSTVSATFTLVGGSAANRAAIASVTAPGGVVTSIGYDPSGLPSEVSRTASGVPALHSTYDYDEAGRLIGQTSPLGFETTYAYEEGGPLLRFIDWSGDSLSGRQTLTYDDDAQVTEVLIGAPGSERVRTNITYSAIGSTSQIRQTALDGSATARIECRDIGPNGRVAETVSAEGIRVRYQYDGEGRVLSVQAGDLGPSSRSWDDACLAHPSGGSQQFTLATFGYDIAGRVITSTDERGRITTIQRDGFGRALMVNRPDGTQLRRGYDAMNAVTWEAVYATAYAPDYRPPSWTDAGLRRAVEYSYDSRGRLFEARAWHFEGAQVPVGDGFSTTRFVYDDTLHTVTTIDDAGNQSVIKSDGLGRVLEERAPGGITRTYAYPDNRTVRVTDPAPSGTIVTESSTTSWGALASQGVRVGSTLHSLGTTDFDLLLRPIAVASPTGARTTMTYDAFGRVGTQTSTVPSGTVETLTLAYDRDGRLVSRTSSGASAPAANWFWTYDGLGRPIDARDPIGAHTTTSYVLGSSLPAVVTDPRNVQLQHTWALDTNQLTLAAVDPAGPDATLSYLWNGLGELVSASRTDEGDHPIANTFAYDSLGGVISETDSVLASSLARTHRHDGRGLRTSTTIGTTTWARTYDTLGRLSELWLGTEGTPIARYTYAGFDFRTKRKLQNQVETRYEYDELGRQTFQREMAPSGSSALATWEREVPLDGVTRRSYLQRTGAPATNAVFQVDSALRLTSEDATATSLFQLSATSTHAAANSAATAATTSAAWRYTLDGRNNWAQRTKASTTTAYTRDLGDALRQIGSTSVTNDARGALRTDGTLAVTYDALGLVKQVVAGSTTRNYRRDALGRVVSETDQSGAMTRYAWDGATRVLRQRPTGVQDLTLDGNLDEHLMTLQLGGGRQFLHQDHLGSVFLSTNTSGAVTEWIKYTAYGEPTVQTPTGGAASPAVTTQYGFNGLPHDFATGLVDMRARMYRPTLGRFLSPDPLGLVDGSNRFAFVRASPLWLRDPFGLSGKDDAAMWPPVPVTPYERWQRQTRPMRELSKKMRVRGVGDVLYDIGEVVYHNGKGLVEMAAHPIRTLEGFGYAITHPLETLEAIWDSKCEPNCLNIPFQILLGVATSGGSTAATTGKVAAGAADLADAGLVGRLANKVDDAAVAAKAATVYERGEFSIIDWTGYPDGAPRPAGPFRLLNGEEYDAARRAADRANERLHNADPSLAGKHIHENHPVKFGGDPVDPANKTPLLPTDHYQYNRFWRILQRYLER